MFQQPSPYQQQPEAPYYPQPMASLSRGMSPMAAFQNDELGNEASPQTGLAGTQPNAETGLSDASLMNAFQNENQPLAFQNDNPPPTDQNNFLQPPLTEEQQQPFADVPESASPSLAPPMTALQPRWDRSKTLQ